MDVVHRFGDFTTHDIVTVFEAELDSPAAPDASSMIAIGVRENVIIEIAEHFDAYTS